MGAWVRGSVGACQYPVPSTQYPVPNTQYPIPNPQQETTLVSVVQCIGSEISDDLDALPIMETDTKERLSAQITGRVQGVGFRNFTQMRARQLGLTGWVRNESDGSVRLEAEGPRGALEDLLDAVHDGPRTARVETVEVDWTDATGEFDVFRVRR